MKRLVIVAPHFGRSGPTRQMIYLVSELSGHYDIEIICVQPEKSPNLKPELAKYPVKLTSSTKWNFLSRWLRLFMISLFNRANILHSYGFVPDLLCSLLVSRKKWVCVARNFPPEDYPSKFGAIRGGILAWAHLGLHRKCRYLVACSEALGRAYQRVGIPSTPICNAVRLPKRLAKLSKHAGQPRFVFVGNLIPRKRVDLACRLFEAVANNEATLDVVGGGGEFANLQKKFGHNPNIVFHGPKTDVWPYIEKATVLINLSNSEGLPNAVLEGLATGCICVLSDIEPHQEIRDCIGDGVIVVALSNNPTDDELAVLAEAVAAALLEIPNDQAQLNLERARQAFGTSRLGAEFRQAYETMGNS